MIPTRPAAGGEGAPVWAVQGTAAAAAVQAEGVFQALAERVHAVPLVQDARLLQVSEADVAISRVVLPAASVVAAVVVAQDAPGRVAISRVAQAVLPAASVVAAVAVVQGALGQVATLRVVPAVLSEANVVVVVRVA
jgi:hypothetical protein